MNVDALLAREETAAPLSKADKDKLIHHFNQKQRDLRQMRAEMNHKLDARTWNTSEGARQLSAEMARLAELQEEVDKLSRALWLLGRRGQI